MKTAVAVRAHRTTAKLEALLGALADSQRYDLFLAANETRGKVGDFGAVKLSHDISVMERLGAGYVNEARMIHCSDMVFASLRRALPGYDFILVIEDDVHFPHGARRFVEGMIEAALPSRPDLLATKFVRSPPDWFWHPKSRHAFDEIYGVFFPFVGMSARAIDHLVAAREAEATRPHHEGPVFCEAFVPSELVRAGGFVIKDANELVGRAYHDDMFHPWEPYLLEDPAWPTIDLGMVHPVYAAPDYLQKRLAEATRKGQLVEFVRDLEARQSMLPAPLRAEYAARGAAVLNVAIMERLGRVEQLLAEARR